MVARKETWRRKELWKRVKDFQVLTGIPVASPVVSLVVGTEEKALKASRFTRLSICSCHFFPCCFPGKLVIGFLWPWTGICWNAGSTSLKFYRQLFLPTLAGPCLACNYHMIQNLTMHSVFNLLDLLWCTLTRIIQVTGHFLCSTHNRWCEEAYWSTFPVHWLQRHYHPWLQWSCKNVDF